MADTGNTPRTRRLTASSGRLLLGAATVLGVAVGGGLIVGLSPFRIAVLAAAVVLLAVLRLWWIAKAQRRDRAPGTVAVLGHFALASVVVFAVIQVIPFGREHSNPPVTGEPQWSSLRTRQLMVDACYDCHSNEVEWPWYTNVAPFSWAATMHVDEGREAVNYSEFTTGGDHEADETIEVIRQGSMPPYYYTLFGLHPEANLSRDEMDELLSGLRATPGLSEDEREDDEDHDD
ncbi:MAG: heme-binding domain-containing protein [Acidimicrobiales bacterium]